MENSENQPGAQQSEATLKEKIGSSLTSIKEKATSAIEALKPGVQSAGETAQSVGQTVGEKVRRGSTAAVGAIGEKLHETGVDEKFEQATSKLSSSQAVKTIESTAKSSINILSRNVNASAASIQASLKTPDFIPNASYTPIRAGSKALTLGGMAYGAGFAVGVFTNTDTISKFEQLLSASDKPLGRLSVWRLGDEMVEICEAILSARGTAVEVITEPSPCVLAGRDDGSIQVFSLNQEGVLANDYSLKVHKTGIVAIKASRSWSYRGPEDADAMSSCLASNVVIVSAQDFSVRVLNLDARTILHHVSLSAECHAIAPVSQSCVLLGSLHGQVVAMDFSPLYPAPPQAITDFPAAHPGGVRDFAFDAESRKCWSVGTDGVVTAWNAGIENNRGLGFIERYFGHQSIITCCAWCPTAGDNGILATGDDKGYIMLWPRSNPNRHVSIHAHGKSISSLSYAPQTNRLISGAEDMLVRAWDITRILDGERFHPVPGQFLPGSIRTEVSATGGVAEGITFGGGGGAATTGTATSLSAPFEPAMPTELEASIRPMEPTSGQHKPAATSEDLPLRHVGGAAHVGDDDKTAQ